MKNICLLVHDDDGQEARLQAALGLTRALQGHLICVDVAMMSMIVDDGFGYCAGGAAMLAADERVRESKNQTVIKARLAHEDVVWDWIDAFGNAADCVLEASNLADLIVLNRKLDAFPYPDMRDVASSILMRARKPIVAVPDTLKRFDIGRALIAWDGGSSVAATIRACIPLLQLATDVQLFMARRQGDASTADEAAEYLSLHGIHACITYVADDGLQTVDELIAEQCQIWHADYVVMGAYSRGRLMEAFGGVTKRMLSRSRFPLVLGH